MYYDERYDETVSVGDWITTVLLMLIPVVNLILLLVWAFSGMAKPSKRNFARAWLVVEIVATALAVVVYIYYWPQIGRFMNSYFSSGFYR